MSTRIPPLLEPYLALPSEASLILLTSVLGASTNWLVLRFLHSTLLGPENPSNAGSEDEPKVLLVSFMRDLTFWKENAKRLGLDLDKFAAKRRFSFVDGLSGLFLPKQSVSNSRRGINIDYSSLQQVTREIQGAIKAMKDSGGAGKIMLVVDQLDLLLATGGDSVDAVGIGEMLMDLREEVHSSVVTISADLPLVSGHQTPLEVNHAAFLVNTAHQADFTIALRLLDSGTARDVSGVLRITLGETEEQGQDVRQKIEERELLYFVGGDGAVRVFERGQ